MGDQANWAKQQSADKTKGGGGGSQGHKGSAAPQSDGAAGADDDGDAGTPDWIEKLEADRPKLGEWLEALGQAIEAGDVDAIKAHWGKPPEDEEDDADGGDDQDPSADDGQVDDDSE